MKYFLRSGKLNKSEKVKNVWEELNTLQPKFSMKKLDSQSTSPYFFCFFLFIISKATPTLIIKLFALKVSTDVSRTFITVSTMCCILVASLENTMAVISAVDGIGFWKQTMEVTSGHSTNTWVNMLPTSPFPLFSEGAPPSDSKYSSIPQPQKDHKSWYDLSIWLLEKDPALASDWLF